VKDTPLTGALKQCSLHSLLMLTSKALTRSGFGDVQILDRRQSRQKSRYGGHELVCVAQLGDLPMRVVVKVINDAIRVRMLDELAGVIDRTKADFGLLVTPHHLTPKAAREQAKYRKSRIEVIDGKQLSAILTRHKVGVRPKGEVDYAFFGELEMQSGRILNFIAEGR
jgi:restriction endonuclease Mrr